MKLSTRVLGVLVVASLPLTGLVSAQAVSRTPTTVADSVTVTVPAFTVGVKKWVYHDFVIKIAGKTSDDNTTVTIRLDKSKACAALQDGDTVPVQYDSGDEWRITGGVGPVLVTDACPSKVPYTVTVDDNSVTTVVHGTFVLRRAARLQSLNAAPEPVKKGGTVTTKAVIQRANWNDDKYHAYNGQKSELQFRTTAGAYANVKAVLAKTDGKLVGSGKQTAAGCWRYTFAGTGVTAPVTAAGDCVAIKG